MSSSGDVLCPRRPLLRGPPLAGVLLQGQAVPERVGSGDPGRAGCCGGDRPGAGLPAGPTGRHHFRPELVYSFIHSFINLFVLSGLMWEQTALISTSNSSQRGKTIKAKRNNEMLMKSAACNTSITPRIVLEQKKRQ